MLKKTNILIAVFSLFWINTVNATNAAAISSQHTDTYYNHFSVVNQEWANYPLAASQQLVSFESDADRIQAHLNAVISYLQAHHASNLDKKQVINRTRLLNELSDYAAHKVFPVNVEYSSRRPCFVDEINTHCAVGYLMAASGNHQLVHEIKEDYNYEYLADIKTDGVAEWGEKNGFTLQELAWIQPAYPPVQAYSPIENGTNGEVRSMQRNYAAGGFVFSGNFTEVNDLPCLNIGIYKEENLSCIGSGIAGIVNGVFETDNTFYAYGELPYDGNIYPMAWYADGTWHHESVPERDGAITTAAMRANSGNQIEMAISHPAIEGQEIWIFTNEGEWIKKAVLNGTVYDMASASSGRVFAGHFNAILTIDEAGETSSHITNNIVIRAHLADEWTFINEPVSDTVKSIKSIGPALYFGGSASTSTLSDICLSQYYMGTMLPLRVLSNFWGSEYITINDIEFDGETNLLIGGNMIIDSEFGTYGQYLAKFSLVLNQLEVIAKFDSPVNTILKDGSNNIYIGGNFTSNLATTGLNHLAQMVREPVSIKENTIEGIILAYPNPFLDQINLKGLNGNTSFSLLNYTGQTVKTGTIENHSIKNLGDLPAGNYVLIVHSTKGPVYIKLIK